MATRAVMFLGLCLLGVQLCTAINGLAGSRVQSAGVRLEVVTAWSDTVLSEASESTQVQLRVVTSGGADDGVSLYDCWAGAEGTDPIPLTDINGCPALHSPMGCMVQEEDALLSPVFALSSLADGGPVNITCSWEHCASSKHLKCVDRCDFFTHRHTKHSQHSHAVKPLYTGRRRRDDSQPSGHSHDLTVSTSIRVLPSHMTSHHRRMARRRHHGHHASVPPNESCVGGRDSDSWLYLNPITCTALLLVLSLFLALHVFFVRSMRSSLEDIRRQMGARPRDKFLVTQPPLAS